MELNSTKINIILTSLKATTETVGTEPKVETEQQEKAVDDVNITSEQLLLALTSIPSVEDTSGTIKEGPVVSTADSSAMEIDLPAEKKSEEATIIKGEELKQELITPEKAQTETKTTTTPSVGSKPPTNPPTGLGITPNISTTSAVMPPTAAAANSGVKPNTSSPSLSNALTSLPDISAALRRLSSHSTASVIEQLSSSSPRIPNMMNTERRSSSSPSEILGNALAAVAANAAAVSRSSPKQPQPQGGSNNGGAATAIGNLAAITANISNLLHSGGFHRNSFSQEDTQKLAAAVARHNQPQPSPPQQQRRKSSMANHAFSNMIELMGRNKPVHKPKLIIKNEQVWKSLEGIEEKHLGYQLYTPHLLLPNLEGCLNGIMEIRVPARYLSFENMRVKKRAVWGTDIYTDDSDIVASKYLIVFSCLTPTDWK